MMKTFRAETPYLYDILNFVDQEAKKQGLDPLSMNLLEVVVEEAVTNIMQYAYSKTTRERGPIECDCTPLENRKGLRICIQDHGTPYNPLKHESATRVPDFSGETPAKGVGIRLMVKLTDEISYAYENERNILTFAKYA